MAEADLVHLSGNARDRESFLLELINELGNSLESSIGKPEAEGFVRLVGLRLGKAIADDYDSTRTDKSCSSEELAEMLVDLKRKIDGGFSIESVSENEIVLVNDRCPFGNSVKGNTSLCQMTSSVFGRVASRYFDTVNVDIEESIARGDGRCRVVVCLDPDPERKKGVNFYGGSDRV